MPKADHARCTVDLDKPVATAMARQLHLCAPIGRLGVECPTQQGHDFVVFDRARLSWAAIVVESHQSLSPEALTPLSDRLPAYTELVGHDPVLDAGGASQNDLRALHQSSVHSDRSASVDTQKVVVEGRIQQIGPGVAFLPCSCDTVNMRNLTVSVDDKTYRKARIRAAQLDTSLSAIVRRFLTEFAGVETDFDRRKRLQDETLASIRSFRAGTRLSRDDVHERDALR